MITRNRYNLEGDTCYQGKSTDDKPTKGVPLNSLFLELDTGKFYYFDGYEWYENGSAPLKAKLLCIYGNTTEDFESFKATAIKTTGKNLFIIEDAIPDAHETLNITENSIEVIYDGVGASRYRGFNMYRTSPYFNGAFIPAVYTLSFDVEGVDTTWLFGLRTVSDNTFLADARITITEDGHYSGTIDASDLEADVYLSASRTGNLTTAFDLTFSNIQLEFGETETDYEKYKERITDIPVLNYFPTGMKSVGETYDELTPTKAITRIGTREYESGDEDDSSVVTDGEITYYVLDTPIEEDINIAMNYWIEWGGTEQIIPQTVPIIADIEYPDGERTEQEFTYREVAESEDVLNNALSIMMGRTVSIDNPQEPLDILMKGE